MSGDPNKLSRFWQELKRRKVIHVITVYAGAAFVIIELINNVTEPLRLPEWTPTLVIIILLIGFPLAVIFSWIYDIHPEKGIVETEKASDAKADQISKSSNSWKIASYISFVVIVALIVLNVIPRIKNIKSEETFDKSIAILPFLSLSNDPEKQYLADGVMEDILLHLAKIEDLRVLSSTSVQQYRKTDKTATEICQELGVSFVLEGSFQKYGDKARLIVQLIQPGIEGHVWANDYNRDWTDIFTVQSEVAKAITEELRAVITNEEIELIEKIPTTSLTAYDFYQRGRDELWKYYNNNNNREALEKAEDLYNKALEYDSTFASAYAGLANIYWYKHYWKEYHSNNFLDSVFYLVNIANQFDDQLAEGYTIRGNYFSVKGFTKQAIEEYEKALRYNPNDWNVYYAKGTMYFNIDFVRTIDNLHKAASLYHGPLLPGLLRLIGDAYRYTGFIEKGNYYGREAFKLDGDSAKYYHFLADGEYILGNYEQALEFSKRVYEQDSNNTSIVKLLGAIHMFLGQYEESLKYYIEWLDRLEALENLDINNMHRIGYAYWQNGFKERADFYFNKQIDYCNWEIESGRPHAQELWVYYHLASIYAFKGEKNKGYKNLRIFNQKQKIPLWTVTLIKDDPLFDNIRNEPEFKQIVRDVEAKYQAEHERVRQWLKENDML